MKKAIKYLPRIDNIKWLPFEDLPRKFIISGPENSGKTKMINNIYKRVDHVEYE